MMKNNKNVYLSRGLMMTLLSLSWSHHLSAAGFALIENGASGLGNAYAGAAAVAEDASTNYFNPAGLSRLSGKQFVFAGHYIDPKMDFTNNGSHKIAAFGGGALSGTNDDAGVSAFVPSFFYTQPIDNKMNFGFGLTVPFGLGTEYDDGWVGRYHSLKSEIKTVNFNPSISYKADSRLSLGFGISAQYIEATLSNKIDSAAFCQGRLTAYASLCNSNSLTAANIGNSSYDSQQELTGDDWSWGWNVGLLYDISETTRFGASYRSNIEHHLTGGVDFTVNPNLQAVLNTLGSNLFSDTGVSAGINLPESVSFSLVHQVTPRWKLLADATWTRWNRYDKLTVVFDNPSQADSVAYKNYQNSWRYSLGTSYIPDEYQVYRFGVAYDESAVRSTQQRTAGSPGDDRVWLSLGYGYKSSDSFQFDIGYAHLFIDDTPIDNDHALFGSVTGSYEQSVDIVSLQITWWL